MNRTAAAVAAVLLVPLVAIALLLSADERGVRLFGAQLGGECLFRQLTGVPCPGCGMTRSIILTLHGAFGRAFQIQPAGPLWVLATLTIGLGLLWLAFHSDDRTRRRIRFLGLVQGVAFFLVLMTQWVRAAVVR